MKRVGVAPTYKIGSAQVRVLIGTSHVPVIGYGVLQTASNGPAHLLTAFFAIGISAQSFVDGRPLRQRRVRRSHMAGPCPKCIQIEDRRSPDTAYQSLP